MPTLQKWPKFSTKMTESWPFMDLFPPNHHIKLFLVHKNHDVKQKKKLKKLGLKSMMHTLPKTA